MRSVALTTRNCSSYFGFRKGTYSPTPDIGTNYTLCCESISDSVWLVSMAATVQFCRAAVPGDDGGEVRSLRIFSELGCGETEIYIDRLDLAPIKSNGLATYL